VETLNSYTSDDRSILLPYFKAWFVEPALAFIPRRVSPNTITLAGLATNIASLSIFAMVRPTSGWMLALTIALLWGYIWCDNVDGAHARRTEQTSTFGEALDHGLDLLNAAFVIYITAYVLGASDTEWVFLGLAVPTATSTVYWEQAELGVFRLGRLNQVESGVALSSATAMSAFGGIPFHTTWTIGPFAFRELMVAWLGVTVFIQVAAGIIRVLKKRPRALLVIGPLLVLNGSIWCAHRALGSAATPTVCLALASNVAFGMSMLGLRFARRTPRLSPSFAGLVVVSVIALAACSDVESVSIDTSTWVNAILFTLLAAWTSFELVAHIRREQNAA
jgi:phosphatidylglycerophosphate synthase